MPQFAAMTTSFKPVSPLQEVVGRDTELAIVAQFLGAIRKDVAREASALDHKASRRNRGGHSGRSRLIDRFLFRAPTRSTQAG